MSYKGVFLTVMATLIIEMLTTSCLRRSGRSLLTFKKHILKKWVSHLGNFWQPLHIIETFDYFISLALSFCKLQLLYILNICFAWHLACFWHWQLLCWHNCELASLLENWTMTGDMILKNLKELITPVLPPRRCVWPWPAQSHRGAAAGVPQKCLSVAPLWRANARLSLPL